jgi:hypothetical protein
MKILNGFRGCGSRSATPDDSLPARSNATPQGLAKSNLRDLEVE